MSDVWANGWKDRIYAHVASCGFKSITEFLDDRPIVSFEELVDGIHGDKVAPIQLQWVFQDEARKSNQYERYLRNSLIRYLSRHVPNGVKQHGDWPLNLALGSWAGSMDDQMQSRCTKIVRRFKKEIADLPNNWIPSNNDALIEKIFDEIS